MKTRIALLSGLVTLVAGAAAAIPSTDNEPATEPARSLFAWDGVLTAEPATPTVQPESMELAVFGPCGCIPRPDCPFPFPFPPTWPPGGPIPIPFPIPNPLLF